jgi:hypothetical protein
VTHDRELVDRVGGEILELHGGRIERFPGGYARYRRERERRREQGRRASELQQGEIAARRSSSGATSRQNTRQAQARQKPRPHGPPRAAGADLLPPKSYPRLVAARRVLRPRASRSGGRGLSTRGRICGAGADRGRRPQTGKPRCCTRRALPALGQPASARVSSRLHDQTRPTPAGATVLGALRRKPEWAGDPG